MKLHKYKFILFLSVFIFSQQSELKSQYLNSPPSKRWRINIGLGCTQLLGDLGGSKIEGTHFIRDYDFPSMRYGFSIGIEHFNKLANFGYASSFSYARLSGNDRFSGEKNRRDRNLSVLTHVYSYDLTSFYSPFTSRKIRFYTGFNIFYFNPTAKLNNRVYDLRRMGTEGQLLNGGTESYGKYSFSIPLGIQIKLYEFKKNNAEIWVDLRANKCFTDYLDDVHAYYADNSAIEQHNGSAAAQLADRNTSDIPGYSDPGAIRGDNRYNDHYCLLTFTYKAKLNFKVRDGDDDGVPDYADKCKNTRKGIKVDENGCDLDTDKDGIADTKDKCPTVPGLRKLKGCPDEDKDGDGILNVDDSCASAFGLKDLDGCPDFDADGIADKHDPCPKRKGISATEGCPDSDGDKLTDNVDQCVNSAGPASNHGCPEITKNVLDSLALLSKSIFFNTASAEIKTESYQKMFDIISILNKYTNVKIVIEGYTDSVGSFDSNMKLSQKRTDAVKAFFIQYGISPARIQSTGFGELNPIEDNGPKTRAKNRRVEIKVVK